MAPFQVYANGVRNATSTEELLTALKALHTGLVEEVDCVTTVDDVKAICLANCVGIVIVLL